MGAEKKATGRHAVLMAASPARRRSGRNRRAKDRRGAALSPLAAFAAAGVSEVTVDQGAFTADVFLEPAEIELPSDVSRRDAISEAVSDKAIACEVILEKSQNEDTDLPRPQLRRGRTWPCEKRVGFDMEVSVHSVTPYAEIYGLHPRFFDFDKGFSMVPARGFGAARVASKDETTARQPGCGLQDDDEDDVASEDDSSDDEPLDTCEYILGADAQERSLQECYIIAS